jgi:hypothetical protein
MPGDNYTLEVELPTTEASRKTLNKDFICASVEELQHWLQADVFSPLATLALIDFLVRHGVLPEKNELELAEIRSRMHRTLPFPFDNRRDAPSETLNR